MLQNLLARLNGSPSAVTATSSGDKVAIDVNDISGSSGSSGTNTPSGSASNSPLDNGEVFDTGVLDLDGYTRLATQVAADQDGTLVGEWYDGPDLSDNVIRTFTIPYSSGNDLSLTGTEIFGRYLRYTFTNDSGADQSRFFFNVILSNGTQAGQLIGVDQFIPVNVLAQLTRDILVGLDGDGTYRNVGVNEVGALNTSNFILDVVRGKYPTYSYGIKFGRNAAITTGSTPEDVWNGGGLYTGFNATSAETVTVISTDNDDRPASTGAHTIRLLGLDADYNKITEDLTLNGTTAVTSTLSYLRLTRAFILSAGSDGQNDGAIIIAQSTTTANIFADMPQETNQTAIAADTVPAGKTRYLLNLNAEMSRTNGSPGSANVRLLVREFGGVFRAIKNVEITDSFPYNPPRIGAIEVPEKSDIKWLVDDVSDSTTTVTAEFEYIDINN